MTRDTVCGVSGFFYASDSSSIGNVESVQAILSCMTDCLQHRGPDDRGLWVDAQSGIALGHRRLSILDLSPAGAQPMHSHCGRYVLVYNGEIYNSLELREAVNSRVGNESFWRGHSDTESFLEACACFGVRGAVERSLGMFAFALWDKTEHCLTLGRDRFGIKPIYWSLQKNVFLFASELKALRRHPDFEPEIDRDALYALLRCNYIPDPMTIFMGVRKLRPGHLLTVGEGCTPQEHMWWSSLDMALAGIGNRVKCHKEAMDELHELLRDAVKRRMVADVPVGAFLSGGIDSSLVVALMQEVSTRPVNTFSIGFDESEFNEATHAKAVADSLGTEHRELYITSRDAVDVIPKLPNLYDEPFADASQIPTYMVSTLARRDVTVALSGDGGDELFAGYAQHNNIPDLYATRQFPVSRSMFFQRQQFNRWVGTNVVIGGKAPPDMFVRNVDDSMFEDEAELRQYIDTMHYLPGDILVKVDRVSMGVSLEVRPPLLDHRIYAHAWRMPPELRRANGRSKWPLRHILDRYVPPTLTERPKMGFGIPLRFWLSGPLKDWAQSMLAPERLHREGWLNPGAVKRIWHDYLVTGQREQWIWGVLAFQMWLENR